MRGNILLGAAAAALATAFGAQAAHAQATTAWSGAPRTSEEDRQFKVNGRVQYDIYNVQADRNGGADESYTGTAFRRVFLGVEGRFTDHWRYNVKLDLSPGDSGTNEVRADDMYLEYAGSAYSIFIGQGNAVSPMEDRDSSAQIPFNERSGIIQAGGFGKVLGVDFLTNGGNWSLGVGVHGDTANNPEATVDEQSFVIARATWAPLYERTPDGIRLLHLGLSYRYRDNGGAGLIGYSARPGVGFNTSFVSAAAFAESDRWIGAEAAVQWDRFGAEAEYGQLTGELPANGEREFSGYYVDLFWALTGESRNYNAADGSFGRITPRRSLGQDGGIGSVMLSLRYDSLDLTDSTTIGGEQSGYVGGVTWQPIGFVKFQLNYADYSIDFPGSSTNDADVQTVTFRTQFDW